MRWRPGWIRSQILCVAVAATLCALAPLQVSCLSTPPPPSQPPRLSLFRRFSFASNGVCINPSIFYADVEGKGTATRRGRRRRRREFTMRNVPGEGDCMFLAVALAAATSSGLGGSDALLRAISKDTRDVVAQVLEGEGNLHVEGRRLVPAKNLLASAARGMGIAKGAYLNRLREGGNLGGLQGGGPELTVLSNVLRRPISIYELDPDQGELGDDSLEGGNSVNDNGGGGDKCCRIKEVGVFGDIFEDPCLGIPDSAVLSGLQPGAYSWHLHVLVVDAGPGEKHACTLLPKFCDEP